MKNTNNNTNNNNNNTNNKPQNITVNVLDIDAFANLIHEYEVATPSGVNPICDDEKRMWGDVLQRLSTAVVYAVLKKCINVSNNTQLLQLRNKLSHDIDVLNGLSWCARYTHKYIYDNNGNIKLTVTDTDIQRAYDKLCGETLSDAMDLMQTAALSIVEETKKSKERGWINNKREFMTIPYTTRQLNKRITITIDNSDIYYQDIITTPIQEVYKSVRREIEKNRAPRTAQNGYSYLSDMATDDDGGADETIYRRFGKYADLGGYAVDCNGKETEYTICEQVVEDTDRLIEKLNLTKRQLQVLKLRLRGYGYRSIGRYLGITEESVYKCIRNIRKTANDTFYN